MQLLHCTAFRPCHDLPITTGMDHHLASLEHTCIVCMLSFHLQATFRKKKKTTSYEGGLPVIVLWCIYVMVHCALLHMQYIFRPNLVLHLFWRCNSFLVMHEGIFFFFFFLVSCSKWVLFSPGACLSKYPVKRIFSRL